MADPMTSLATSTTPNTPNSPLTAPNPVDAYKNPYTKDILGSALDNLNKVGQQRRNQLGTEAFHSGAYGDARHGVEDANLTTDLATQAGQLSAQINGDAYDKGMGWLNTDTDRQTNTALANANLDNQWEANQLAGMNLGNSLYQQNLTNGMSFADALKALDTSDTALQQNKDNVKYDDFLTSQNWDSNKLAEFMAAINGQMQTQNGTQTTSPPSTNWASSLGAGLGSLFKQ